MNFGKSDAGPRKPPGRGVRGVSPSRLCGTARLVRNSGRADAEELSSKTASIVLAAGDTVRIETGGGGGFGDPAERDPAAQSADLLSGKILRVYRGKT